MPGFLCKKWRDTAREVRGEEKKFSLVLAELVPYTPTLIWVAANIAELPGRQQDVICAMAAGKGALATLQWARKNGCFWDAWTCTYAAKGGHLKILQWAHENGCEWDEWTCANAAWKGHLSILRWAHENGCPWNKGYCWHVANEYNHSAAEAWIAAQPK